MTIITFSKVSYNSFDTKKSFLLRTVYTKTLLSKNLFRKRSVLKTCDFDLHDF
jgi:hypothetical protein